MKYRKKPIVVEAVQWFLGRDVPGVLEYCGASYVVTIHQQNARLDPGDWVITESDGDHHYPCKPDEFARIYEPVEE